MCPQSCLLWLPSTPRSANQIVVVYSIIAIRITFELFELMQWFTNHLLSFPIHPFLLSTALPDWSVSWVSRRQHTCTYKHAGQSFRRADAAHDQCWVHLLTSSHLCFIPSKQGLCIDTLKRTFASMRLVELLYPNMGVWRQSNTLIVVLIVFYLIAARERRACV